MAGKKKATRKKKAKPFEAPELGDVAEVEYPVEHSDGRRQVVAYAGDYPRVSLRCTTLEPTDD